MFGNEAADAGYRAQQNKGKIEKLEHKVDVLSDRVQELEKLVESLVKEK